MKKPSNWLREGEWEGYIPLAEEAVRQEAKIVTALGNVRRDLGGDLFRFLSGNGTHETTIAMLDGATLEPPAHFKITTSFQRTILEKHQSALERMLGDRLRFSLVAARKAG